MQKKLLSQFQVNVLKVLSREFKLTQGAKFKHSYGIDSYDIAARLTQNSPDLSVLTLPIKNLRVMMAINTLVEKGFVRQNILTPDILTNPNIPEYQKRNYLPSITPAGQEHLKYVKFEESLDNIERQARLGL